MNLYRKMHKEFFFSTAYSRCIYGVSALSFEEISAGKWLTEDEIADFTLAYMQGGEL